MKILGVLLALSLWVVPTAHAGSGFALTVDATFSSLYVIDGFRMGNGGPVLQPSVELQTPLAGVSGVLWSSLPFDRNEQRFDEFDLMIKYRQDFAQEGPFAFNLHGFADYWFYPKLTTTLLYADGSSSKETSHGNKLHAGVSLIRLIPLFGSYVVPTYNLYYSMHWANNQRDQYLGGARHELELSYYHGLPAWLPGSLFSGPYVGITSAINYEDGVMGALPGWSHVTTQVSTGISALGGWSVFLALNKQWTFIPSVNTNDEFWTSFSISKHF